MAPKQLSDDELRGMLDEATSGVWHLKELDDEKGPRLFVTRCAGTFAPHDNDDTFNSLPPLEKAAYFREHTTGHYYLALIPDSSASLAERKANGRLMAVARTLAAEVLALREQVAGGSTLKVKDRVRQRFDNVGTFGGSGTIRALDQTVRWFITWDDGRCRDISSEEDGLILLPAADAEVETVNIDRPRTPEQQEQDTAWRALVQQAYEARIRIAWHRCVEDLGRLPTQEELHVAIDKVQIETIGTEGPLSLRPEGHGPFLDAPHSKDHLW